MFVIRFSWFLLRLTLALLPFVGLTLGSFLYPKRALILTSCFFLFFSYSLALSTRVVPVPEELILTPEVSFSDQAVTESFPYDLSPTLLQQWQAYAQLQPTHRDVLYNLALLHLYQNDIEKYSFYVDQAERRDPNKRLIYFPID